MGFDVKISVIVPVYNSEEYLRRCIDSILKQSYELFELIAVDDGSSDNSWKILENYSKQDNRIRIIHQENAGPGKARNRGLDAASGEYVVFVDSDDFIENDYFLKLSKKTEDVIFIDVNQVDESFELICTEYMSDKREISKDEFIRSQMTGKINWGGVRKAVKRELLEKHNIRYSDHKIGEEAIFSFFIMYYAASFSFIEGPVYTYINRKGSQSDFKMDDPWGNVAELLKKQIEKKKAGKVFVPISNADYSKELLNKTEIQSLENYLWLFTKDWPSIYEVYDKTEKVSLQIVGQTEVYGKIKSEYKK